jgi:hypothetical protein
MQAALDFFINDRNLFEMKIFLTISIQIKKRYTSSFTFMVETVFGGVQWVKKQIFCLHRNRKRRGTRGEYYKFFFNCLSKKKQQKTHTTILG